MRQLWDSFVTTLGYFWGNFGKSLKQMNALFFLWFVRWLTLSRLTASCNDKQAASYYNRLYCLIEWWDIESWTGTFNVINVIYVLASRRWLSLLTGEYQFRLFCNHLNLRELLLSSTCFHIKEKLEFFFSCFSPNPERRKICCWPWKWTIHKFCN